MGKIRITIESDNIPTIELLRFIKDNMPSELWFESEYADEAQAYEEIRINIVPAHE